MSCDRLPLYVQIWMINAKQTMQYCSTCLSLVVLINTFPWRSSSLTRNEVFNFVQIPEAYAALLSKPMDTFIFFQRTAKNTGNTEVCGKASCMKKTSNFGCLMCRFIHHDPRHRETVAVLTSIQVQMWESCNGVFNCSRRPWKRTQR